MMANDMGTLNHIALAVSDSGRTANLFVSVFGARLLPEEQRHGPSDASVQLGDLVLVFVEADTPQSVGASHIAFNAPKSNAESIGKSLQSLGLRVEAPRHGPPDRALYFADYDNNLFEVCFR